MQEKPSETQIIKQYGHVAVLMGGKAAEREISLKSGRAVCQALISKGVDAKAVDVKSLKDLQALSGKYDRVFVALHGRWGEDGVVQAILQDIGLPFTGSEMAACALGMDKLRCKWLWMGAGLPTPKFQWITPNHPIDYDNFDIPFPVMVKPSHEGSSIGISKANDIAQLKQSVIDAQKYDSEVLIEQWISGEEYTCGILDGMPLPMIKLQTSHDFYDYEAKYQSNDTQYLCPCGLNEETEKSIQAIALKAFNTVGLKDWGRVDFMIDEQGQAWLIEINTIPGMTDHSLVPMAAQQHGIEFSDLVLRILKTTL
ncbi:D-alanine--D-alanine ligase [Thiomicrorhabdus indica]|uniref:D-alanine--D-alanine ligase n=1 Tax=Thiomicrorhabdus indica TaxID=2267253 RepID=UPI00102D849C|nr:D-alanine--D-alanine ligase [Thiomicrorhabdus indica]